MEPPFHSGLFGRRPRRSKNEVRSWWSWKTIIEQAPILGIPNFQRGQVWSAANRVALLESIYEESPCGSFVFWRPLGDRPMSDFGVPLVRSLAPQTEETIWLVDGQQRSRSLLSIYDEIVIAERERVTTGTNRLLPADILQELESAVRWRLPDQAEHEASSDADSNDTPEENDEEDDGLGATNWFVWTSAIRVPLIDGRRPFLGHRAELGNAGRYSMFRSFRNGALNQIRPPAPRGLIPMGLLLAPRSGSSVLGSLAPEAMEQFARSSQDRDVEWLQANLPWGPLFLTGNTTKLWSELEEIDASPLKAVFDPSAAQVREQMTRMYVVPHIAVGELPRGSESDAINAYVRINRAGVRVQAEERALAVLTRWHPGILGQLADFMRERDGSSHMQDPRSLLTHASERTFGFALWIRTVTRFAILKMFPREGIRWFGPEAIERPTVTDELEVGRRGRAGHDSAGQLLTACATQATRALLLLDGLLTTELNFDHRMARPDVRSTLPLLDLLSHLSTEQIDELRIDGPFRAALARALHWTLLHRYYDKGEMDRLCERIHGVERGTEESSDQVVEFSLSTMLGRYLEALHELWWRERMTLEGKGETYKRPHSRADICRALREWSVESFTRLANESRSLTHPAVGWLYALERRRGAREFDWEVQCSAAASSQSGAENGIKIGLAKKPVAPEAELLSAASRPEKQHIVPFSHARKIAGKGGTRATASPANSLGNLTWLSSRQNGLTEIGFADRWMAIDPARDQENLSARGFNHPVRNSPETAAGHYLKLQADALHLEACPEDSAERFNTFCRARLQWMSAEMDKWLGEALPPEALELLGLE